MAASGYGVDASLHIPGEVTHLAVVGGEIHVRFEAREDSPLCKSRAGERRCPEPGNHLWRLAWDKGYRARTLQHCAHPTPLSERQREYALKLDGGCLRRVEAADPGP